MTSAPDILLATLETKISGIEKNVDKILHILQGNGNGLQVSTRVVESKVKYLEEQFSNLNNRVTKREVENARGKWLVLAAILSGCAAFLAAMVQVVI